MNRFTRVGTAVPMAIAATLAMATAAFAQGVSPASVAQTAKPGDVITVTKTVSTPVVPPKPDVVLVVDRTGSMGGAIANVKAQMADVVNTVKAAQPDAQFAVTSYCDTGEPNVFMVNGGLSASTADAVAAINSVTLCNGGDEPEAQLNALWSIGDGGDAIAFRPDSSRVIAWFGDAPGHDPSEGHTLNDAITSLQGVDARVVAIGVSGYRLDLTGQATAVTQATGGTLLSGVPASEVSAAILTGLQSLPVTVTGTPTCDPGLSVSLSPASQTVTSGTDATFTETITVAADAQQGATLNCTVPFTLNGTDAGPDFTQSIAITVQDVTPPTVACVQGVNPAGETTGSTNNGFYRMVATDNVTSPMTVSIKDLGSGQVFGPYATGTTFKLTQAPGGTVKVKDFTGEVKWKFTFNGDAQLIATDAAGNTATATCLVPPHN